jgi:hypothetical protein
MNPYFVASPARFARVFQTESHAASDTTDE